MNEKIKGLKTAIKMQEDIMREAQNSIRQAEATLEAMNKSYKRAMEEKLHLQAKLIQATELEVERQMELTQETRRLEN
jgi:exonuclease VII small subunit